MSYYISSPDSSSSGSFYESNMSYVQRPVSASPTLSQSYPGLAKMRYEACRGFDLEDDLEFCPALAAETVSVSHQSVPAGVAPSESSFANYTSKTDDTPIIEIRRSANPLEIINPATGLPIGRR